MKNYKNIVIGIVLVLAIVGAYFFPKYKQSIGVATNNSAGTTFNSAKVAQINISLASTGQNGTSTSLTNTDSTDRIITDGFLDCSAVGTSLTAGSGTGLISVTFQAATTSTASPAALTGSNFVFNVTLSTSTPDFYVASSTSPAPSAVGRVWPTGTFLTFFSNATNTASCTVGVHYLGS